MSYIIDILHLKDNFQSQQMQQGNEDERKTLMMYEEILGCKVIKEDLLFPPPTHIYSPDGVVLEECLVEVKRICPGTITLKEAMCSRGICK